MQIATHQFAETSVAMPVGRIDHRNAAAFEAALLPLLAQAAQNKGALVLDLSGVDYISSVGLRVLMIAAKQMRAAEASLVVASLQSVVAEIFTISRFDKILTVCASLDAAMAQRSAPAQAAYQAKNSGGAA